MGFRRYVIKRTLMTIPVLLGLSVVVFLLIKLTPGDPISALLPAQQQTPENIARVRERLGLNRPLHIQYGSWLFHALQGDLGRSLAYNEGVISLIIDRLWPTVQISLVAIITAELIAIPVGILSAVNKNSWIDHVGRIIAFLGISLPSFWLGIMVIMVFSLWWQNWFGYLLIPSGGYVPPSEGVVQWLRHVLPPGITLGVGYAAITTRMTRSTMVDVLNSDYIQTIRSKGATERRVVYSHAFRNALIPIVTVLGMHIGFLFNGSVVVEQVFQWPGIGRLLYQSVVNQDLPLIQGVVLFVGVVFVFANLLVDLLYAYLDPRIRYD